jgi:hypothetical protein
VVTVAADRGDQGRRLPPEDYARQTLEQLPDFEGSLSPEPRRARGSPYRNARIDGVGSVRTSRRPQLISVVAYRRPGRATYVLVAFRNAAAPRPGNERVLDRMLSTLRARPPAG